MLKVLKNPETGASIEGFVFDKRMYDFPVNQTRTFPQDLANALKSTYGFLEEVELAGKFKCKYGDYANDVKVAVLQHEKTHVGEPQFDKGKEFVTPQAKLDQERRERLGPVEDLPADGKRDKDDVEWYGAGLETDSGGAE